MNIERAYTLFVVCACLFLAFLFVFTSSARAEEEPVFPLSNEEFSYVNGDLAGQGSWAYVPAYQNYQSLQINTGKLTNLSANDDVILYKEGMTVTGDVSFSFPYEVTASSTSNTTSFIVGVGDISEHPQNDQYGPDPYTSVELGLEFVIRNGTSNGVQFTSGLVGIPYTFETGVEYLVQYSYIASTHTQHFRACRNSDCLNEEFSFSDDSFSPEYSSYDTVYLYGANNGGNYAVDYLDFGFVYDIIDPNLWEHIDLWDSFRSTSLYMTTGATCFIGRPCDLYLPHSSADIGDIVFLFYDVDEQRDQEHALSFLVVPRSLTNAAYLAVPPESSPGQVEYCVYSSNRDEMVCDVKINWVSLDEANASSTLTILNDYYESDPCSGLSNDSSFFYGINCGFRKVLHWAFVPSPDAYTNLQDSMGSLMNDFPFSVYKQVEGIASSTQAATSTASINFTSLTNGVLPMGTTEIDYSGLPEVGSLVYNFVVYLIWLFGLGYFVLRFFAAAGD